jgi:hypothetical protein
MVISGIVFTNVKTKILFNEQITVLSLNPHSYFVEVDTFLIYILKSLKSFIVYNYKNTIYKRQIKQQKTKKQVTRDQNIHSICSFNSSIFFSVAITTLRKTMSISSFTAKLCNKIFKIFHYLVFLIVYF